MTVKSPSPPMKIHRNPFHLAREYKYMIDSGEVKSQAELAKIKGISRARITQILNLLKLDKGIVNNIELIGDLIDKSNIRKRTLKRINQN